MMMTKLFEMRRLQQRMNENGRRTRQNSLHEDPTRTDLPDSSIGGWLLGRLAPQRGLNPRSDRFSLRLGFAMHCPLLSGFMAKHYSNSPQNKRGKSN
ncbi:hypothetical protein AVEN_160047-1 [Araneus ventricosus]|uniref:Uncharacterized protein n=1 Tax=Araneus ventricosus TaxID=182803 RepID=A0A4Y2RFU0_ARAVE|nr:hypothetical protein AVEN_160047-1 [Araneus ventricosus]